MNIERMVGQSYESEDDSPRGPWLRQREVELKSILGALNDIIASKAYNYLQKHVFSAYLSSIERKLKTEKDEKEMYRLQGQLVAGEKFSELKPLRDLYKRELDNIEQQLTVIENGKT